jgi:hypothetical protein
MEQRVREKSLCAVRAVRRDPDERRAKPHTGTTGGSRPGRIKRRAGSGNPVGGE